MERLRPMIFGFQGFGAERRAHLFFFFRFFPNKPKLNSFWSADRKVWFIQRSTTIWNNPGSVATCVLTVLHDRERSWIASKVKGWFNGHNPLIEPSRIRALKGRGLLNQRPFVVIDSKRSFGSLIFHQFYIWTVGWWTKPTDLDKTYPQEYGYDKTNPPYSTNGGLLK